jgi:hypothetical protein
VNALIQSAAKTPFEPFVPPVRLCQPWATAQMREAMPSVSSEK